LKALSTLRKLLLYQGLNETYKKIYVEYREQTLENTIKLLLRCGLNFEKIRCEKEQERALDHEHIE